MRKCLTCRPHREKFKRPERLELAIGRVLTPSCRTLASSHPAPVSVPRGFTSHLAISYSTCICTAPRVLGFFPPVTPVYGSFGVHIPRTVRQWQLRPRLAEASDHRIQENPSRLRWHRCTAQNDTQRPRHQAVFLCFRWASTCFARSQEPAWASFHRLAILCKNRGMLGSGLRMVL